MTTAWILYTNRGEFAYIHSCILISYFLIRACRCWDVYRQGKCADKLSNYLGETERLRSDSYRYFVRTSASGASIGDTSKMHGHPYDFAYTHDQTCYMDDSNPRKVYFSIQLYVTRITDVYIFFLAREIDPSSGKTIAAAFFLSSIFSISLCYLLQ